MTKKTRKPVVIDLDEKPKRQRITPAEAAPVPDVQVSRLPAMAVATRIAAHKPSRLVRWFFWALATLISFALGVMVWDFAAGLMARNIWLGRIALGLLCVTATLLFLLACKELATLARMRRIDGLRAESDKVLASNDLTKAKQFQDKLIALYRGRDDVSWALVDLENHRAEAVDADAVLAFSETQLMAPLDKQALEQIEVASRQVAAATAIVPLALADVIVALTSNIRMIRKIAQIYGGRSGSFGSWRLTKAVAAHLVATGAVAIGDDLIGSVAGGGVLSKISRRFGEGLVNGALTARVGVAAMEVCRPMSFNASPRPPVTEIVKSALTGLFSSG